MDSTLSIRFADLDDINTIGFIAQQTWPATYGEILSPDQLDYMLTLFCSPSALRQQMLEARHHFLILEQDDEAIGFASWAVTSDPATFKLHKLYILPGRQGKGMGKAILNFIFEDIRLQGAKALQLNVNRYNKARQFYEKMGFAVIKEEDIDVGNNYYMNDYVMEVAV
jgi:diamine N-acetyltransferase